MRFSLRDLLLIVLVCFVALPAVQPTIRYFQWKQKLAGMSELQVAIERLKAKLELERNARSYAIGRLRMRVQLEEAELGRLAESIVRFELEEIGREPASAE